MLRARHRPIVALASPLLGTGVTGAGRLHWIGQLLLEGPEGRVPTWTAVDVTGRAAVVAAPPGVSGCRGGQREREGLAVRARAQRVRRRDALLERHGHGLVGRRRRPALEQGRRGARADV